MAAAKKVLEGSKLQVESEEAWQKQCVPLCRQFRLTACRACKRSEDHSHDSSKPDDKCDEYYVLNNVNDCSRVLGPVKFNIPEEDLVHLIFGDSSAPLQAGLRKEPPKAAGKNTANAVVKPLDTLTTPFKCVHVRFEINEEEYGVKSQWILEGEVQLTVFNCNVGCWNISISGDCLCTEATKTGCIKGKPEETRTARWVNPKGTRVYGLLMFERNSCHPDQYLLEADLSITASTCPA